MKIFGSVQELLSLIFRKNSQQITVRPNQSTTYTAARDIQLPPGDADHVMVSASSSQAVSNKTIDSSNSITLKDSTAEVVDATDATKKILFNAAGTTGTSTTLAGSQTANRVLTLPDATDTLATLASSQSLSNKTLDSTNSITLKDSTAQVVDATDATKRILFDAAGTTGTATTLQGSQTVDRTLTLPDVTDTLVARTTTETLLNKKLSDSTTSIVDSVDATKTIKFDAGGSTGTSITITGAQTANRVLTLPDATDTLTANSASQTLTNKDLTSSTNTLTGATAASFTNGGTVTLPSGTRTVVARDTTDTLTNKDIDGGTASNTSRFTAPKASKSTLDGLTRKEATVVYGTDTAKLYVDDGNTLKAIGSGSSGINYLSDHFSADALGTVTLNVGDTVGSSTRSNPTQWGTSAGSAIIAQSSDSSLRGTTNYLVSFTANGQFVESPLFTLDGSDLGKALQVAFANSGVSTSDDVQAYIVRYNSSNVLQERIPLAGTASATTPFSARLGTGVSQMNSFFVSGSTASDKYALRILRNANATAVRLDSFSIGPQSIGVGAPANYLGSVSISPDSGAFGTVSNNSWKAWRLANKMIIEGSFTCGTTAGGAAAFTLPSGYSIDTTAVGNGTFDSYLGYATRSNATGQAAYNGTAGNVVFYDVSAATPTKVYIGPNTAGSQNGTYSQFTGSALFSTSDVVIAKFEVPIAEWAGSANNSVQADRAVEEFASNSSSTDAADTSSFVYGPAGSTGVLGTTALTAPRAKRVRFQSPIQKTDTLILEFQGSSGTWMPLVNASYASGICALQYQGANTYGISLDSTTVSSTDVDVVFGQYMYPTSSTYAQPGAAWTNGGVVGAKWRVRKVSGGATVGYPIANSNQVAINAASEYSANTRLGQMPYAHGGSYNGGAAPTITLLSGGGTLNTVNMSEFIPYQMADGTWRMRFNMRLNLSAVARTTVQFAINGITFFAPGGNGQAVTGVIYSAVATNYATAASGSNYIEMNHVSSSVNEYNLSGDVKLASKPTWAY